MFEADPHELGVVARADPDRQPALVDRLWSEIADAGAQKADPVLVGIKAGKRLGKGFADAVATIRPRHHPVVDPQVARIKTDRVIAGGHDNALDAGSSRRFEQVVRADNIRSKDRLPFALA